MLIQIEIDHNLAEVAAHSAPISVLITIVRYIRTAMYPIV